MSFTGSVEVQVGGIAAAGAGNGGAPANGRRRAPAMVDDAGLLVRRWRPLPGHIPCGAFRNGASSRLSGYGWHS
ncbi:hypothetical protein O9992_27365 [Vibrio lentus]|nr:hypothetical protein [Vibrio lentus]